MRQPLRFDPATIDFQVAAAGYEPSQTRLTLAAGEIRDLQPTLRRRDLRGTRTITSVVLGAQVQVDGQGAGTVPVELRLAPGEHAIKLEHPAYRVGNSSVVLRSGERRSIDIGLDPLPRWYETWWFWTGVGAVVTTGVVVGVALSTERGPDSGDIPPGRITSSLVAW